GSDRGAEESRPRDQRLIAAPRSGLTHERPESGEHPTPLLGRRLAGQLADTAFERSETGAARERPARDATVLRLGAGAVAPAPQALGQQVASLGRTLGRRVASEVGAERLLVGGRQRRVARPRHSECTEAIVGRLTGLARLRELGE